MGFCRMSLIRLRNTGTPYRAKMVSTREPQPSRLRAHTAMSRKRYPSSRTRRRISAAVHSTSE